jgi:hypothetical protein
LYVALLISKIKTLISLINPNGEAEKNSNEEKNLQKNSMETRTTSLVEKAYNI